MSTTFDGYPGKPLFLSEYGTSIKSDDPSLGVLRSKSKLEDMRYRPWAIGGALWTLNDYRSLWTGTPDSENRSWGIVTTFRQKKRVWCG